MCRKKVNRGGCKGGDDINSSVWYVQTQPLVELVQIKGHSVKSALKVYA